MKLFFYTLHPRNIIPHPVYNYRELVKKKYIIIIWVQKIIENKKHRERNNKITSKKQE